MAVDRYAAAVAGGHGPVDPAIRAEANAAILDRFDLTIELLTGRPAQARPVADAPQGLLRDIENDVAVRPDQLADIAEEIETESRGRNIWETGTALPGR